MPTTYKRGAEPKVSWSKTCSYFSVQLIKQHIFKPNCWRKSRQEKESVMVVWFELKTPWLRITVRHHSASLVMPNSYPREGSFNPNLTTIKDSCSLDISEVLIITELFLLLSSPISMLNFWRGVCINLFRASRSQVLVLECVSRRCLGQNSVINIS